MMDSVWRYIDGPVLCLVYPKHILFLRTLEISSYNEERTSKLIFSESLERPFATLSMASIAPFNGFELAGRQ